TGFADIVLRTKYTAYKEESTALAAAVDVRLPTGRQEDLLGTGSTSYKFSAIGSIEGRRVSGYANAGATIRGLAPEISYGAAVAVAATGTFSLVGELLGRWIDSSGHLVSTTAPHPLLSDVNTIRLSGDSSSLQIVTIV